MLWLEGKIRHKDRPRIIHLWSKLNLEWRNSTACILQPSSSNPCFNSNLKILRTIMPSQRILQINSTDNKRRVQVLYLLSGSHLKVSAWSDRVLVVLEEQQYNQIRRLGSFRILKVKTQLAMFRSIWIQEIMRRLNRMKEGSRPLGHQCCQHWLVLDLLFTKDRDHQTWFHPRL